MFVVLGATGRTGKVVASTLLAQGKAVRAVVHDAAKGQAFKDNGAEVAVADAEDRAERIREIEIRFPEDRIVVAGRTEIGSAAVVCNDHRLCKAKSVKSRLNAVLRSSTNLAFCA